MNEPKIYYKRDISQCSSQSFTIIIEWRSDRNNLDRSVSYAFRLDEKCSETTSNISEKGLNTEIPHTSSTSLDLLSKSDRFCVSKVPKDATCTAVILDVEPLEKETSTFEQKENALGTPKRIGDAGRGKNDLNSEPVSCSARNSTVSLTIENECCEESQNLINANND